MIFKIVVVKDAITKDGKQVEAGSQFPLIFRFMLNDDDYIVVKEV